MSISPFVILLALVELAPLLVPGETLTVAPVPVAPAAVQETMAPDGEVAGTGGEEAVGATSDPVEALEAPDPLGAWERGAYEQSLARALRLQFDHDTEWPNPGLVPGLETAAPALAVDAAGRMVHSQVASERLRALEAMVYADPRGSVEALLHALADSDPEVRSYAVSKLPEVPEEVLFPFIMSVLLYGDQSSVSSITEALPAFADILTPRMLEVFTSADQPLWNRRAAAYALGWMGSRDASPWLAEAIWSADPGFSMTCAEALRMLRDPDAEQTWQNLVLQGGTPFQHLAVGALAELGTRGAYDALLAVASGLAGALPRSTQLRAVYGLATWPLPMAVPGLIEAMSRNSSMIRDAAQLLRDRTGQQIGDFPDEWQGWYAMTQNPELAGAMPIPGQRLFDVEFLPEE